MDDSIISDVHKIINEIELKGSNNVGEYLSKLYDTSDQEEIDEICQALRDYIDNNTSYFALLAKNQRKGVAWVPPYKFQYEEKIGISIVKKAIEKFRDESGKCQYKGINISYGENKHICGQIFLLWK